MAHMGRLRTAIEAFRAENGGTRADRSIRAGTTGDATIDRASDEEIERVLAGTKNTATSAYGRKDRPKTAADLNPTEIYRRYNSAGKPPSS